MEVQRKIVHNTDSKSTEQSRFKAGEWTQKLSFIGITIFSENVTKAFGR